MKRQSDSGALDLLEMRRQLTALRSRYSENLLVASLLNRFLVKIALLSEPNDDEHGQHLQSEFAQTLKKVDTITSDKPTAKRPTATKPSK
ncbi:hypothetical protein MA20_41950 [Bradyrhizobium japonicum]|uniref:Uncharacterized protein n=1 Tax=Bradyrhizobium japonicum TaxID=375 RepID=A0A0A3XKS5_BRAJP|nr:hypothetical protein MA20_41950 [Bradyrhizobium japonicum]